jgi:hypothetical protein
MHASQDANCRRIQSRLWDDGDAEPSPAVWFVWLAWPCMNDMLISVSRSCIVQEQIHVNLPTPPARFLCEIFPLFFCVNWSRYSIHCADPDSCGQARAARLLRPLIPDTVDSCMSQSGNKYGLGPQTFRTRHQLGRPVFGSVLSTTSDSTRHKPLFVSVVSRRTD